MVDLLAIYSIEREAAHSVCAMVDEAQWLQGELPKHSLKKLLNVEKLWSIITKIHRLMPASISENIPRIVGILWT